MSWIALPVGSESAPTTKMIRRPEGYQVPYAERIRTEASVPTMAVGLITTPAFAEMRGARRPRRSGGDRPRGAA